MVAEKYNVSPLTQCLLRWKSNSPYDEITFLCSVYLSFLYSSSSLSSTVSFPLSPFLFIPFSFSVSLYLFLSSPCHSVLSTIISSTAYSFHFDFISSLFRSPSHHSFPIVLTFRFHSIPFSSPSPISFTRYLPFPT